jgi:archaemetzincin
MIVLGEKSIPESHVIKIKSTRYRADSILNYLSRSKPDSIDYLLAVTEHDISITKRDQLGRIKKPQEKYIDWGVFGYGFRPGPACVLSVNRLKSKNELITFDRLRKVAIHEVGHNMGLKHCPNKGCVMADAAESIKTVDNGLALLCAACRNKLD